MKVYNIPRIAALEFKEPKNLEKFKQDFAWISIFEKGVSCPFNKTLDQLLNIKLKFYDVCEKLTQFNSITKKTEVYNPITDNQTKKLVNFIIKAHKKERSIIVNCLAGISRSGGIAQFCEDILGYEWPNQWKQMAIPNALIYRKMVDYYQTLL